MKQFANRQHLICANCEILLDCDWMGISLDYDDECKYGDKHCQQVQDCDCEEFVKIQKEYT